MTYAFHKAKNVANCCKNTRLTCGKHAAAENINNSPLKKVACTLPHQGTAAQGHAGLAGSARPWPGTGAIWPGTAAKRAATKAKQWYAADCPKILFLQSNLAQALVEIFAGGGIGVGLGPLGGDAIGQTGQAHAAAGM